MSITLYLSPFPTIKPSIFIEHGSWREDFTRELALSDAILVLGKQPDNEPNKYEHESFASKSDPKRRASIAAGYYVYNPVGGSGIDDMKTTDFEHQADYATALSILNTTSY